MLAESTIISNEIDVGNEQENNEDNEEVIENNGEEENMANSKITPEIKEKKKNNMFSLTSLPVEMGDLKLVGEPAEKQETNTSPSKEEKSGFFKKIFKAKQTEKKPERTAEKNVPVPFPRILTITELVYCIYNANIMDLYRYDQKKQKEKKKNMFLSLTEKEAITYKSDIIFISGHKNSMIVGLQDMFFMYHLNKIQNQEQKSSMNNVHQKLHYPLEGILSGKFEQQNILILTSEKLLKFKIENNIPKIINSYPISIKHSPNVSSLKILDIIKENTMYFIVYTQKIEKGYQQPNKQSEDKKAPRIKEILKLIQFDVAKNESVTFEICKMPEAGLFDLSKVFYKGKFQFLISLHEEIVLIEKIHRKYIAVDNITVNSNKLSDESKKGQLVLVNEEKIIFNDNEQIYVYNFSHDDNTMKLDLLDNFKAPQANESFILYDGILLQNVNTNIQVLFYFNSREIKRPGKQDYTISKNDEDSHDKINFLIFGIKQMKPLLKLNKLLKEGRQPKQIDDFIKRFEIEKLEYLKVSWQVSKKTINDIITHLLPIGDQNFIKNELDEILKKEPHDMNFLRQIQEAQNNQLKDQLTNFLLKNKGNIDTNPKNKQILENLIINVLESNMFYKKLKYMSLFEAYKLVEFTDIKKLKAVSLKEQIKLLSCKGYELRLRIFLNHFKYLAIANFKDIFTFLVEGKTEQEIKQFFISFHFIFPEAAEKSILNCFFKAEEDVEKQKNNVSVECELWQDFGNTKNMTSDNQQKIQEKIGPAQTIQSFAQSVVEGKKNILLEDKNYVTQAIIRKMQSFKQQKWFIEGSFQKHCMLSIDQQRLLKQFRELKDYGVCNIIYQYLYKNVQNAEKREEIIKNLIIAGRISKSTSANFKIRQLIYKRYFQNSAFSFEYKLPEFLILDEIKFFQLLYKLAQKKKNFFFDTIKSAYEEVVILEKGFFEEKFSYYLKSVTNIDQIVYFLEEFSQLTNKIQHQNLLHIILDAITNILKIRAKEDTQKVLIALDNNDEWFEPHVQTARKIIQGNCFYQLYDSFELDYTYAELNKAAQETNNNKFINEIIGKFCRNEFKKDLISITEILAHQQNSKFINEVLAASPDRKIKPLQIKEPIQFFRCLIQFRERISFEISIADLLKIFILNLIQEKHYNKISTQFFSVLKDENQEQNPTQNLENLILNYVKKNQYSELTQDIYTHISKCLELIYPITISAKREQSLLELCKHLVELDVNLLKNIQVRKALSQNPLNFLMNILKLVDLKILNEEHWEELETLFQNIYQKFLLARSIDLLFVVEAKKQMQFYEFQVEAGYYFLQKSCVKKAIQICNRLIFQEYVYYFDLIFSSACYLAAEILTHTQSKSFLKYIVHLIIFENKYSIPNNNHQDIIIKLSSLIQAKPDAVQIQINICAQDLIKRQSSLEEYDHKKTFPSFTPQNTNTPDQILNDCINKTVTKVFLEQAANQKLMDIFYFTFIEILDENPIESFYFLMKNKTLVISKIVDFLDKHPIQAQFYRYLSLVIYLRALTQVQKQFYPTISFFQEKEKVLSEDQTCRDINILIQKLKCLELQKKTSQPLADALSKTYEIYMTSINKPYLVNLTQIPAEAYQEEIDPKREIKHNEIKIRQEINENERKFKEAINKVGNYKDTTTTPIYPTFNKPNFDLPFTTNIKPELPSQKYQNYEEVKRRELQNLKAKQKDAIKAQTKDNNQIESILQKYRMKRQQRINKQSEKQKSIAASSEKNFNFNNLMNPNNFQSNTNNNDNFQSNTNNNIPQTNLDLFQKIMKKSESQAKFNSSNVVYQAIKNDDQKSVNLNNNAAKRNENFIFESIFTKQPRKESANFQNDINFHKPEKPYEEIKRGGFEKKNFVNMIQPPEKQFSVASSISQLRRKMQENQGKLTTTTTTKVTIADIKKQLQTNNEAQILKYLQKLEVVSQNSTLARELIRRMYEVSKNLKFFIRTMQLLLKVYDSYQKIIEKKALKIASQALKIQTKVDPKAIFDFTTFFGDVKSDLNEKEYEKYVFKRIRPNILKVINDNNVHSLAKMILYGLSLEKKYENKVYIVLLEIKFNEYNTRNYDDKMIAALIEKVKSIFTKLPKEKRGHKITKLLKSKLQQNPKKLKQITRIMEDTINRSIKLRNIATSPDDEELLQIFKNLS